MGSNPVESPEFFRFIRFNQSQTFVPQEVHSWLQYLSRHGYTLLSYDIYIYRLQYTKLFSWFFSGSIVIYWTMNSSVALSCFLKALIQAFAILFRLQFFQTSSRPYLKLWFFSFLNIISWQLLTALSGSFHCMRLHFDRGHTLPLVRSIKFPVTF